MKNSTKDFDKYNTQNHRELSIVARISQNILETLDYEKILQIISDGMSELLEIETAAIYMLGNKKDLYLGATTPPLDPQMPDTLRKANLSDHPHIEKAMLTHRPVRIADTNNKDLSQAEKEIVELRKLRSLLYFPFIQEKKVLGVLILGSCGGAKNYSESQIELGQVVANQLSVAIQNSQLHKDLKNYNDNLEQLVSERTHELEAANEEYQAINWELQATNDELSKKKDIVIQQNKEIEIVLKNLKETQSQLVQSEKMASLGILTAGVAHEINNPLNFIMGGYTGLINELKTHDIDKERGISVFLEAIKTGIDRAADIVQGLNQLSRDNDNYDEECDIQAIIDNCLTILHSTYINRIEISKDYEKKNLIIRGNTGKLHQVFINIFSNAIDSIENNGEIHIATFDRNNKLEIYITDTGCGIPAEDLTKIFDPFFTTKDPGKGTGLGLFITNKIIQNHDGELHFESLQDKGTKVQIYLPKPNSDEQ